MLKAEEILEVIRSKVDHPSTIRELMQLLRLPREQRASLRRRLASLVESGSLIKIRGRRYGIPDRMDLVTGRVQVKPRGFGFVTPDYQIENVTGDLYIAGANLNQAMHGDRVVARVEHHRESGRSEGRIVRILERAMKSLVGRYEIDRSGMAYVVPFDQRVLMDVHVPESDSGHAVQGEMVVIQLTRWPTATRGAVGRVIEVLGEIDAPGVDTQLIIRKHGLPDNHDEKAITEAKRLGQTVRKSDIEGRQDFRHWPTVTIDGKTSRDFDDAVTLEKLSNGNYWLGVHIADVAHYVPEGGALDAAAYARSTSVYFPEKAVHMFPEDLATGLCSLRPKVDRLVQSCLMEINLRGSVERYELHDGVISSNARMTYQEVNAILSGKEDAVRQKYEGLVPLFEMMAKVFQFLNGRRRRRGSIDFDLPQSEFLFDDEGRVESIVATERNLAHRLIEEFMLVANETVAFHLEKSNIPALHRVHEDPDPQKIAEFEEFVASLGFSLGAPTERVKPRHFQKLLSRIHGSPEERPVASLMLRTMQQARYDSSSLGHFGLATPTYTHFTSPIRRYPDLVVHRALRNMRVRSTDTKEIESSPENLSEVARHVSKMERRAEDAEREIVQWKKVRFMADKVGNEFTGYVTGVTSFGLFIELVEYFVDGLVHISSMVDDYYHYMETQHSLHGENIKKVYRLGDLVRVQLVRVDREHRKLELALVDVLDRVRLKNEHPDASQNIATTRPTKHRFKGSRARTRLRK